MAGCGAEGEPLRTNPAKVFFFLADGFCGRSMEQPGAGLASRSENAHGAH